MNIRTFSILPFLFLTIHCNGDTQTIAAQNAPDGSVVPQGTDDVVVPDGCDLSGTVELFTEEPIGATSYCDQISFCVDPSLRETVHTVTGAECEIDGSLTCDGDVLCIWLDVEQVDQDELDSICALTNLTPMPAHDISCDLFLP